MTSVATPLEERSGPTHPREFEAALEFRAMGTDWRLGADEVESGTLEAARALIEQEEQRCSRFRADSALSRLNAERVSTDATLAQIVRDGLHVSRATAGAFDPTAGAAVIAAGYDRTFEALTELVEAADAGRAPRPCVTFEDGRIRLRGEGLLDLGGIAKGWTADRVADLFVEAGSTRWLVDAGGDVRAWTRCSGGTPIAVDLTGLTIALDGGAAATSSTRRRAWDTPLGRMHHIVSREVGTPAAETYVHATVVAPLAATADALATSMLVDMPSTVRALPAFEAEALLFDDQGVGTMTPGMERHLV